MAPVVDNGPTGLLLNVVLVAEGFEEADLPEFAQHAERFADRLFATPPFDEARCGINVFRIDVASTATGADDPIECGGTGRSPATYFDASYCAWGIRRGMSVDEGSVVNVVTRFVPQWHVIIVLVNSQIWGGMGGQVAKSCVAPGWEDVALHEMGHSLFGLADEYEYFRGCPSGETDRDNFPDFLGVRIEPAEPNITIFGGSGGKWADLIASGTPLPTTSNPDPTCRTCDPRPSPVPAGTVGTFEGAGNYHCKIFRPEFDCMMNHTGLPFCAVCRRRIRETLASYQQMGIGTWYAPLRIRRIDDYAQLNGFAGGFPNFNEADHGQGLVYGSVLLRPGASEGREVPAADLGGPDGFQQRFRAVQDFATANGFVGGFPNFNEADHGQGLVYGCVLVTAAAGEWRDVPAAELGNASGIAPRFRAVQDYATANGFVGGFPNFNEADYGQGLVYGCVLVKAAGEWRDVPAGGLCAPPKRLNDARFITQTVPSKVSVGEAKSVTVMVRNIGAATWTTAAAQRLGAQDPQDNLTWGLNRVSLPAATVPGAIATFQFNIVGPSRPDTYLFRWRMVQDGVAWFGDFTPEVSVRVVGPPTTVPEVVGLYKQKATDKVVAAGLVARFTPPPPLEPNNPYVAAVSPEEGTTVDGGSTVTMQLQPGPPP
jgi:hypothetical protein